MAARDDGDPRHWQTGIKTIQLVAESEEGRFVASESYEPCADAPPDPVEATYTVPSDPPPIVRLAALAEDHAGHMDTDEAEFPTGDWYGTLEWSMRVQGQEGWTRFFGHAELALSADHQGKLTGSMLGTASMEGQDHVCPPLRTIEPTVGRARLTGLYTPGADSMSIAVEQVETVAQGQLSACMGVQIPAPTGEFAVMPHTDKLERRADGSFHASGTNQWGSKFTLTLHPAGQ
jgi:hypothetical protein